MLLLPRDLPSPVDLQPRTHGPDGAMLHDKGGGLYGYTDLYGGYDGGQAEAVRVPYADVSPRVVPEEVEDGPVLFLTDIFPTGWRGGAAAQRGGETIAVFGCGPVGLIVRIGVAQGAGRVIGIDILPYRLEWRSAPRAARPSTPMSRTRSERDPRDDAGARRRHRHRRRWHGGSPHAAGQGQCRRPSAARFGCGARRRAARRPPRGTVSVLGVYGSPYDNFPVDKIFDKNLRMQWGQAPVQAHVDKLFELIREGRRQRARHHHASPAAG